MANNSSGQEEIRGQIKRAWRSGTTIPVKRHWLPSTGNLFLGCLPLMLVLLALPILIGLGLVGRELGFTSWLWVNLLIALPFLLTTPILLAYGFLAFLNHYQIFWGDKFLLGHYYYLDLSQGVLVGEHIGLLSPQLVDVEVKEGQLPRWKFRGFAISYRSKQQTRLSDIANPQIQPQGVVARLLHFGDLFIPTAQRGAEDFIPSVREPDSVMNLLTAASEMWKSSELGGDRK